MITPHDMREAVREAVRQGRIETFIGPNGETRYRLSRKELRVILKRYLQYPRLMDEETALSWAHDLDTLQRWGLVYEDGSGQLTASAWELAGRWIERWLAVRDESVRS